MYAANEREELSRQALVADAVAINSTGRRYFRDEAKAERLVAARNRYEEAHGVVGALTLIQRVEYMIYMIGLVCVYGIDILLFGSTAQYIASLVGGEGDLWTTVAKYVAPACFLGIEVMISLQIAKARHARRLGFGSSAGRMGWIAIGVLAALVMPLASIAAAHAAGEVADDDATVLMIVVLAVISFAAHVLILFAGRLAQEAKTYLTYTIMHGLKARLAQRASDRTRADLTDLNSRFIRYVHAWRAHNLSYGAMPSGPFDQEVADLLRRQFPQVTTGRETAFATIAEETP